MNESILHCDMNAFFASVECRLNPKLRNVPMAVSGNPQKRHGIILAKNEIAKKFGVTTAETIWQAKRKCPNLVLVPPRHGEYAKFSAMANTIYESFTDKVERFGIDESWLDVRGSFNLFGDGFSIAEQIRKRIRKELGMTVSIGVSFNKVFSKLGSDYKKPDATTLISRENFKDILYPLTVGDMLFVGKRTSEALRRLGIRTIGELAAADANLLRSRFGVHGTYLSSAARGEIEDEVSSIENVEKAKSIGNSVTYPRDISGDAEIKKALYDLADRVSERMRKKNVQGSVVQVVVKNPDFEVLTRQSVSSPTNLCDELYERALKLMRTNWDFESPIRMLGISASHLEDVGEGEIQMSLDFDENKTSAKKKKMQAAIDECRKKFGNDVLHKAIQHPEKK